MKLRTQKSRIIFQQEKFVDYKDHENVLWAPWVRIRNETRLILKKVWITFSDRTFECRARK